MSLKGMGIWCLVALIVGLLAGLGYWIDQADQLRDQLAVLSEQNQMLTEKSKHLSYVNDLAVEFSMDPAIVTLVDRYSREYMKDGGPEWRLVRTPEFMSYIMLSLIHVESKGNTEAVGMPQAPPRERCSRLQPSRVGVANGRRAGRCEGGPVAMARRVG